MGPGVGGMKQWLMYRPMDSATDIATLDAPVRRAIALRMGFRTTKPLSQNTGMETIQPMSSMASSGCFLPTSLTTQSAILSAAPVLSSSVPTRAPKMITMPMLENVPEKPAPMTLAMPLTVLPSASVVLTSGIPAIRPNTREMAMIARNGWIFSLLMQKIISAMAKMKTMINPMPVIDVSSLFFSFYGFLWGVSHAHSIAVPPEKSISKSNKFFLIFC